MVWVLLKLIIWFPHYFSIHKLKTHVWIQRSLQSCCQIFGNRSGNWSVQFDFLWIINKRHCHKSLHSFETVKSHRKNLLQKIGVNNVAALVRRGLEYGLIWGAIVLKGPPGNATRPSSVIKGKLSKIERYFASSQATFMNVKMYWANGRLLTIVYQGCV